MYQLDQNELEAIKRLFESKKLFRYQGKDVATQCSSFEHEFAEYLGVNHALFVTSGTNALVLALRALGISPGDEVIVPSYTFVATVAAVLQVGAVPIVASVGDGLTVDPVQLEKILTKKTKAIIPVHMDGLPVNIVSVMNFAKKYSLFVIEDVAQAIGGEFNQRKLGSFGDASCFSFNMEKIITCGEGGLVAFKDESIYKKALQLHDFPVRYGASFKDYLSDIKVDVGYSMRMSEISAVIIREQFKKLPNIILTLRENRRLLLNALVSNSSHIKSTDTHGECGTHIHFKLSDPIAAGEVAKQLTTAGILSQPLYARPSHCFWLWQDLITSDLSDLRLDRMHLSSIIRVAVDFEATKSKLEKMSEKLNEILAPYA
ncbi:MAG: DegT/DnrJ/EryC1/StrS family aminotransferase [Bacteriovoracia bacterium]